MKIVDDSRAKALISNEDYFTTYSKTRQSFVDVHNVSTNTEYSDFGVFIAKDQVLFASTKPSGSKKIYDWNKQPFLNIYGSKDTIITSENGGKIVDLKPKTVIKLEAISSRYHESSVAMTNDGKTMYFTRDNYNGKKIRYRSREKGYKSLKDL